MQRELASLGPQTRPERRVAHQRQLVAAQVDLADIYGVAGRTDDVERQAKAALAGARAIGAADLEVKARAVLAMVARKRRDPKAVELYEEAIVAATRTGRRRRAPAPSRPRSAPIRSSSTRCARRAASRPRS